MIRSRYNAWVGSWPDPSRYGCRTRHRRPMLITAGNNADRVRNEAAFAKLCGVCPIPAGSGKTNGALRTCGGCRGLGWGPRGAVQGLAESVIPTPFDSWSPVETNATRMYALLVGLPDINVLGVEDGPTKPLRVHAETASTVAGARVAARGRGSRTSARSRWSIWRRSGARGVGVAQAAVALPFSIVRGRDLHRTVHRDRGGAGLPSRPRYGTDRETSHLFGAVQATLYNCSIWTTFPPSGTT